MNTLKRRASYALTALILSTLALASCSRAGEIKLPATPPLTGGLGWAVVKDSYVRLKESPAELSRDIDHLQRGSVFKLEERELGKKERGSGDDDAPKLWYRLESELGKGWVIDAELDIYSTEAQAKKAAESYR